METQIINNIIHNFDFGYIVTVNILTYIVIKLIDDNNGDKAVSVLAKRTILIISMIIVALAYIYIGKYNNVIVLINSAITAPVMWSWVIRPIINKLGFGYKQETNK